MIRSSKIQLGGAFVVGALALLSSCGDSGYKSALDAAPDLSLPPQVTHLGVNQPVCCLETTQAEWRVMYLASPQPGLSDNRGRDVATKGELHLADAYGTDLTLATSVPRAGYVFSPDGRLVFFLAPSDNKDKTYALKFAALSAGTLGTVNPVTVIERGLDDKPFNSQAFFSPSGRYLLIGVAAPGIAYSTDMTIVDVVTARVIGTFPNGSFNYIENVTANDTLVYQNATASKVLGVPSVVGLYTLPLAAASKGAAGAAKPALIDSRTTTFQLTSDEGRVLYTKQDGTLWMFDFSDKSRVQVASHVVQFTLGPDANGPVVWVDEVHALHVQPLFHPELVATAPGVTDPWSAFQFSPDAQTLYFFDRTSSQDSLGDLFRVDLSPSRKTSQPQLVEHRVSQTSLQFVHGRMRYIRTLDGRGEIGELVSAELDGSDVKSIANGVAVGSIKAGVPRPPVPTAPTGNPNRGVVDAAQPYVAPVWAQLVNAKRDTSLSTPLFDESEPIVGALGFSRDDGTPSILDPQVHLGAYSFSPDGYVLLYVGGATLDTDLAAYLGTLHLEQTLVDQAPVTPMLNGVSEVGSIRDRAVFVAAPGASPPGVYFIRY